MLSIKKVEKLPKGIEVRDSIQMLKRNVQKYPNKMAVILQSPIWGEVRHTWQELDQVTNKLANGFISLGLKKGDHIATLLSNFAGAECYYTYLANHKIGAVNVPVNVRYVSREVEYILSHSDSVCLILEDKFINLIEEIRKNLSQIRYYIIVGEKVPEWGISFQEIITKGSEQDLSIVNIKEDDLGDLIYTTGTTGRPKGVMLPRVTSVANGIVCNSLLQLKDGDILYDAIPFFTSTGCRTLLNPPLYTGATRIMDSEFNVEKVLKTIEKEKVTHLFCVPSMIIFILESPDLKKYDTSSLKYISYGGSVMPSEVIKRLVSAFGVKCVNGYGLTEGGTSGTFLDPEFAIEKSASIGCRAMALTKMRVVDENDDDVAPGEVGEIVLRGPSVMSGYYKDPIATAEALRNGWLHTGDMGKFDDQGFLYYVDRKKDIIIRGGFNISTFEVEEVIYQHPAVLEAAVIGKPHPKLGEDVKAVVVLKKGENVSAEEIIEFCKGKLADFKVPREVQFIDALPRNPMGKVSKVKLREMNQKNDK